MEEPEINSKTGQKSPVPHNIVEKSFERLLWNSRFIVLLGVIFGALAAIVLFIAGSLEIFTILKEYFQISTHALTHEEILISVIGAIDFYLIGLVLLIFSFGIYELFISEIDVARVSGEYGGILEIETLDDLKNKIIKVIIMVLIVSFFQRILSMSLTTAIDMLAMAVSICVICIGVYYIGRHSV